MTVVDHIRNTVALFYDIPVEKLTQPNRGTADIAWARMVSMHIAYEITGLGLVRLGRLFGRDHTTVWDGWKRVKDSAPAPVDVILLKSYLERSIQKHGWAFVPLSSRDPQKYRTGARCQTDRRSAKEKGCPGLRPEQPTPTA